MKARLLFALLILPITCIAAEAVGAPAGAGLFDAWIAYIVDRVQSTPGFAAIFGGLIFSWVTTHWLKMTIPKETPVEHRQGIIWRMAFLAGSGSCFAVWFMSFDWDRFQKVQYSYTVAVAGLLIALVVGCASPMLWPYVQGLLVKLPFKSLNHSAFSYEARKNPLDPAKQEQADQPEPPPAP